MTAATILSQIGFSVAAFGWRFRLYAILSAVTIIVFGALPSLPEPALGQCNSACGCREPCHGL